MKPEYGKITIKSKGDFTKTLKFLRFISSRYFYNKIEHYAKKGVVALSEATPIDSGESSDSWGYEIDISKDKTTITWTNSNTTVEGVPVVLLVQYGHATRNGGYVEGFDFINPAIKPIFDEMAESIWREVQNA
jgi:hypothetical protein